MRLTAGVGHHPLQAFPISFLFFSSVSLRMMQRSIYHLFITTPLLSTRINDRDDIAFLQIVYPYIFRRPASVYQRVLSHPITFLVSQHYPFLESDILDIDSGMILRCRWLGTLELSYLLSCKLERDWRCICIFWFLLSISWHNCTKGRIHLFCFFFFFWFCFFGKRGGWGVGLGVSSM